MDDSIHQWPMTTKLLQKYREPTLSTGLDPQISSICGGRTASKPDYTPVEPRGFLRTEATYDLPLPQIQKKSVIFGFYNKTCNHFLLFMFVFSGILRPTAVTGSCTQLLYASEHAHSWKYPQFEYPVFHIHSGSRNGTPMDIKSLLYHFVRSHYSSVLKNPILSMQPCHMRVYATSKEAGSPGGLHGVRQIFFPLFKGKHSLPCLVYSDLPQLFCLLRSKKNGSRSGREIGYWWCCYHRYHPIPSFKTPCLNFHLVPPSPPR